MSGHFVIPPFWGMEASRLCDGDGKIGLPTSWIRVGRKKKPPFGGLPRFDDAHKLQPYEPNIPLPGHEALPVLLSPEGLFIFPDARKGEG
jgi:hypothetical protein